MFVMTKTFENICLITELGALTFLRGGESANHDPHKMYFSAVAAIKIALYYIKHFNIRSTYVSVSLTLNTYIVLVITYPCHLH